MIPVQRVKLLKLLSQEGKGLVAIREDETQQILQVDAQSDGRTFTAWQKTVNGHQPFEVTIEKGSEGIYVACDEKCEVFQQSVENAPSGGCYSCHHVLAALDKVGLGVHEPEHRSRKGRSMTAEESRLCQEAPFSLSTFVDTAKGYHMQLTVKANTAKQVLGNMADALKQMEALGAKPSSRCGYAQTEAALPKATAPDETETGMHPHRSANGDGTDEYELIAGGTVSVELAPKGEKAYKFKGGRYSKYGVRIWPEVMETLGWELDSLKPGTDHKVDKQAKILVHEGKVQKVIAFLDLQREIKSELSAN